MQAGVAAFPALGASEYEQGFDFSLSTPQNLNTFLFSIWHTKLVCIQLPNKKYHISKICWKSCFLLHFHWKLPFKRKVLTRILVPWDIK